MTLIGAALLRPGDLVHYDGADHQVIALAGTSVWLRSEHGAESVVLLAYQMASPEFAVIDGAGSPRARWQLVRVHELAKRLGWTPQTSGFLRARGEYVTAPHNMLADMVLRDIRLEFAVAPNTSETADDVLDPYLLVAVLLSDEFFAPGGR